MRLARGCRGRAARANRARMAAACAAATCAARTRSAAGRSLVAQITVSCGPRRSIQRWASRPRSPIRATTTASARDPETIDSSSVLLPAPGAPKIPTRAPRPNVSNPSTSGRRVQNGCAIGARSPGERGSRSIFTRAPRGCAPPSSGWPRASIARPSAQHPSIIRSGGPAATGVPHPRPAIAPYAAINARSPSSAQMRPPTRGWVPIVTPSPTRAAGKHASIKPPRAPTTMPRAIIAARASFRAECQGWRRSCRCGVR